mgnify:CR=1 FL=1
MLKPRFVFILSLVVTILSPTACAPKMTEDANGQLAVVATTSIVADIVRQVGGNLIELKVLLPVGTDPHTYTPSPQELAELTHADIIFANGAGLESFLETYLRNVGTKVRVVELSNDGELLPAEDGHEAFDPHTWTNPVNVMDWADMIAKSLGEIDPEHNAIYHENAAAYIIKLEELDTWIVSQVAQIPTDQRKLVSDHHFLGYFAQRYGFQQIGAVIPGTSTLSEPSAQEMARLEDLIRNEGVRAIFVDKVGNPLLSERVSMDTGVKLVYLYSGSLTEVGGEAAYYLDYMRYNVNAIIASLK